LRREITRAGENVAGLYPDVTTSAVAIPPPTVILERVEVDVPVALFPEKTKARIEMKRLPRQRALLSRIRVVLVPRPMTEGGS